MQPLRRAPKPGCATADGGPPLHSAYVSIGSNLGPRALYLQGAIDGLHGDRDGAVCVAAVSSVYETEPVGGPTQGSFLNAALHLRTALGPVALLDRLLLEEAECGRRRGAVRNVPRTIDLDLLLYEDERLETPTLTLPHPRMHERSFVLVPLAEIAPGRIHPTIGRSIAALSSELGTGGVRRTGIGLRIRAQGAADRDPAGPAR